MCNDQENVRQEVPAIAGLPAHPVATGLTADHREVASGRTQLRIRAVPRENHQADLVQDDPVVQIAEEDVDLPLFFKKLLHMIFPGTSTATR